MFYAIYYCCSIMPFLFPNKDKTDLMKEQNNNRNESEIATY